MPYIKPELRSIIYWQNDQSIWLDDITNAGELNFAISSICKRYLVNNGTQYKTINDILGALEGAKLEFYRRVAVPYEEQKIKENGDIY